jgi:O-methyltransferase
MLEKVIATAAVAVHTADRLQLYRKYRDYTMSSFWDFMGNLYLAGGVEAEGDLVECGAWKGGMIAAIAEMLGRRAVLFDSFEGLPEAQPIDGQAALAWQSSTKYNATAAKRDAVEAMSLTGVDYEIRKGWFADTVPAYAAEQRSLAFLRLDGDWYDSILLCLEHLYPLVVPGGLVLIHDYGYWDGCTRAVHDYLSRSQAAEDIGRFPTRPGLAYLRKR